MREDLHMSFLHCLRQAMQVTAKLLTLYIEEVNHGKEVSMRKVLSTSTDVIRVTVPGLSSDGEKG